MFEFEKLKGIFAVCKCNSDTKISDSDFLFYAKTDNEISLVCREENIPDTVIAASGKWRGFRISGNLDFSLTGILSAIASVLADEKIGIFAVSTYDTDYIFVKESDFENALNALKRHGYKVRGE